MTSHQPDQPGQPALPDQPGQPDQRDQHDQHDQPNAAELLSALSGGDLSGLLAQAQQMQQALVEAQQRLAESEVTGSAGGGLVRATVNGAGEVTGLEIDPQAIDPADAEGLADLVLAAIRDANRSAEDLRQQTVGPLTQGLGGLDLPGF